MTARDVTEQRSKRCGRRRRQQRVPARAGCRIESGDQADAGGLDVAFAPGNLTCEPQSRLNAKPQLSVEQLWRIEEGVAMQTTQSRELGVFKARDRAEDALLSAVLQFGLKADHVVERGQLIVLA